MPLLSDLKTLGETEARAKGLRFELRTNTALPRSIASDATRLKQILTNLIVNAIKFTDRDGVRVTAGLDLHTDRRPFLRFDVADSGPGIAPKDRERLFLPFERGEGGATAAKSGSGLGLTIARNFARALGGDVVLARSEPGEGSVFVCYVDPGDLDETQLVTLMDAHEQDGDRFTAESDELRIKGKKVLLVEDSEDNRFLLAHVLESAGAEVECATDGIVAVEKALAGDFDLMLLDIELPYKDGYQVASELRRRDYDRPIVALTAHAMEGEFERCLDSGCDGYIAKPVEGQVLVDKVASFTGGPVSPRLSP
jgi:CheY-like chemotaxis protein